MARRVREAASEKRIDRKTKPRSGPTSPSVVLVHFHQLAGPLTDYHVIVETIAATTVTGLLGPNGAGKTTLLRIVASAILPDHGDLTVFGADPRTASGRLMVRRRLGYLPPDPGFHPNFTTFEFIDYVAILNELTNRKARHEEVRRVLDVVGMHGQRSKKIKALSGAQAVRQRVLAHGYPPTPHGANKISDRTELRVRVAGKLASPSGTDSRPDTEP